MFKQTYSGPSIRLTWWSIIIQSEKSKDVSGMQKRKPYPHRRQGNSRNMRYGDGWAYDSTQGHYKRAKPTWTDPEDDRKADSSLPIGQRPRRMIRRKITPSGRGGAVVKNGGNLPHKWDSGSQDLPVLRCTDSKASMRVKEMQ